MLNIINTQYIYINSVNRGPKDNIYDLTIDIPDGIIRCNPENETLALTATHFNITKNLYYVNDSNCYLKILGTDGNMIFEHYVTPSNYTFKKLASYITDVVPFPISMSWDANRNKYIIDMHSGYSLDFRPVNSMWYLLGFNKGSVVTKVSGVPMISPNVLNIYLSHNIDDYIENVTPHKNTSSIENSTMS